MSYLSHRRALPAALAACLALGLGSAAASAAAPAGDAQANVAQARRGARARRPAARRPAARPKPKGGAFLNGTGVPGTRTGSVGDFYLRTSDRTLYGPKTARGWGNPVSLVGPTGATGPQGNPGANGTQGPAGTPAFSSGVVTTVPGPAALTGTYDGAGDLDFSYAEVGTVTLPAGVSLVQLRLRVAPGGGYADNGGAVDCFVRNASTYAVGGYAAPGQIAADTIGWTTFAQPTTLSISCALSALDGGTPGEVVAASMAGTQVVVFGTSVPGV